MKTNYLLKLSTIVGLIFGLSFATLAAPDLYLTSQGSVTLKFTSADGYNLSTGDKVIWQEFDAADAPVPGTLQEKTYNGNLTDVNLLLEGIDDITELGGHYFKASIITADPANCGGDVSDPIEIYRLPDLGIALNTTISEYCATLSGVGGVVESEIIATTTLIDDISFTLPADVLLDYSWAAKKDDVDVTDVTTLGEVLHATSTAELTTSFTLNTEDVGNYKFIASVQYPSLSGGGIAIRGASVSSSNELAVDVTPEPGKPTITFE